jgi:UDP-N-acetylglucosamine--N-acetylmuramyl-(pentapeptide) pyrophosphoryl-undecaprenol N-acetylglucosamine transferase
MNTDNTPLVILAAGGTGGHVFPAEALAGELGRRGYRLALITDRRGDAYGGVLGDVTTYKIRAGGVAGKGLFAKLKSIFELAIGTWQARRLLSQLKPKAVVGFGGYASVPTMVAACFGKFKTVIHEQNAVLGRANRLLAPKVDRIATSYETVEGIPSETASQITRTGMPVRDAIADHASDLYPKMVSSGALHILVMGGSMGARVLSDVVPAAVGLLTDQQRANIKIVQQCRPEDLDRVKAAYESIAVSAELDSFFDDIPEKLSASHLLIARAGASTVAEVTVIGRPSILVPYPHAIDNHQDRNAHAVDEAGAGWLIPEPSFTPKALAKRLEAMIEMPVTLNNAAACAKSIGKVDAVHNLAGVIDQLIGKNGDQPTTGRQAA